MGTTRWGPSGGGVWSSPTVDIKRQVVYAATGNMYTEPQQPTSDAIMAFDLDTGAVKWTSQVTAEGHLHRRLRRAAERRELSAGRRPRPRFRLRQRADSREAPDGKDRDRRRPEVGRRLGVRSGQARARCCGSTAPGKGSALGGLEFGSAVDSTQAYFAVSDMMGGTPGGLHAVKLSNGERAWYSRARDAQVRRPDAAATTRFSPPSP